ncbi:hypothetical protein, partial [Jannaschia formosa]|uniref:hypothetical protein n=1 Tax=Jannaschia formosa TaxID=2259592 RepID=UPI001074B594
MRLLALETRAARLEGAFGADPELGLMWRAGAALTEACRSVALEDIHVTEGDVVLRAHEHGTAELGPAETARGVEAASDLLAVIAAPGDLRTAPETVIARCLRGTLRTEIDLSGPDEHPEQREDRERDA